MSGESFWPARTERKPSARRILWKRHMFSVTYGAARLTAPALEDWLPELTEERAQLLLDNEAADDRINALNYLKEES